MAPGSCLLRAGVFVLEEQCITMFSIEFPQIHRGRRTPIRKVSAFEWFNKQIRNSSRVDSHNGIELQPLVMAEAANAEAGAKPD